MTVVSEYWANSILNGYFRSASVLSKPANLYVCLLTAPANDTYTGSTIVEPDTGAGYARVALPTDDASWTAPDTDHKITNAESINFPQATSSWVDPITGMAICDASSGGNLWYWADFADPITVNDNDTFQFAANQLVIQFDI